jgi:hypothetical protein
VLHTCARYLTKTEMNGSLRVSLNRVFVLQCGLFSCFATTKKKVLILCDQPKCKHQHSVHKHKMMNAINLSSLASSRKLHESRGGGWEQIYLPKPSPQKRWEDKERYTIIRHEGCAKMSQTHSRTLSGRKSKDYVKTCFHTVVPYNRTNHKKQRM